MFATLTTFCESKTKLVVENRKDKVEKFLKNLQMDPYISKALSYLAGGNFCDLLIA